jgi:hypothetical protein
VAGVVKPANVPLIVSRSPRIVTLAAPLPSIDARIAASRGAGERRTSNDSSAALGGANAAAEIAKMTTANARSSFIATVLPLADARRANIRGPRKRDQACTAEGVAQRG